jgi:hypothetical protein
VLAFDRERPLGMQRIDHDASVRDRARNCHGEVLEKVCNQE